MAETLLDIITTVADELVVDRPAAVVSSTSPQVRNFLASANAAGRDLMRAHEWSALHTLGSITTANGTSSYALASDYDRMISDTNWNTTSDWMLAGPDTPQYNRFLNDSGVAQTSVRQRFRMAGTNVKVWPTPTGIETITYEYVSNKWARSSGAVAQIKFLADTDTSVFDFQLMVAEVKWRFMASRGMFADALKAEAMNLRDQKIAADLGGTIINLAPPAESQFIDGSNIADGNWDLS